LGRVVWSDAIPLSRCLEADAAYRFMEQIGLRPTHHLCVRWQLLGYTNAEEIYVTLQRFLDGAHRWFKRNGATFAGITIRENPPSETYGEHFHTILHIPDQLVRPFKAWCWKNLNTLTPHKPSAIRMDAAKTPGDLLRGYLFKGGDADARRHYADILGVISKRKTKNQGSILGQRVFISRSINRQAQNRPTRTLKLVPAPREGNQRDYIRSKADQLAADLGYPLSNRDASEEELNRYYGKLLNAKRNSA